MRRVMFFVLSLIILMPAAAQTIAPLKTSDQVVKVRRSGRVATGDAIRLFVADSNPLCNAVTGTDVPLVPATGNVIAATGATSLTLKDQIPKDKFVCATIQHGNDAVTVPPVQVGGPTDTGLTPPSITPPLSTATTVTLTIGTIAAAGDPVSLFSSPTKDKCVLATATRIPLTPVSNVLSTPTTTLTMNSPLPPSTFVCGIFIHNGKTRSIVAVPVIAPAAPPPATSTIAPALEPGKSTIVVTIGTDVALGDPLAFFSASTIAACGPAASQLHFADPAKNVITAGSSNTFTVTEKLADKTFVCGFVSHPAVPVTLAPVPVAAPASSTSVSTSTSTSTAPATTGDAVVTPAKFIFSIPENSTVSVGAHLNIFVTALDDKDEPLASYDGKLAIQTTDAAAVLPPGATVAMAAGSASLPITFTASGKQTLTVSVGGKKTSSLDVIVTTDVAGCASCFASIGAGAAVFRHDLSDYQNVQNVLQKTHLSNSTPEYLVGLAYKLPWHTLFGIKMGRGENKASLYDRLGCTRADFSSDQSDAKAAYCYPFKAFINFKFSPDSSQTFSGFTYGISHSLHKRLDVLFGLSYTPFSQPSPGFMAAARTTFIQQTAAQNPCYKQFTLAQFDDKNSYDGVPTQLMVSSGTVTAPTCTAGSQIYNGTPLVTEHHSGFFIGIAVPLSFKSFLQ